MNTTRMGLAIFFFLAPSFAAAAMRTVAVSDHQPPGTPLGSTFDAFGFSPPVINNQGQVAFRSTIDNAAGFSDDVGIWSESGGSLVKVGFEGDPAPGTKADYSDLQAPFITTGGTLAFRGATSAGASIWLSTPGNLDLVATVGDLAPGTDDGSGTNFAAFSSLDVDALSGTQVAFNATLTGPGTDLGIWRGDATNLELIVRDGDAIDRLPPGITVKSLRDPVLSGNGEIAFRGFQEAPITNGAGIWVVPTVVVSSNVALAKSCCFAGDTPPGVASPTVFDGLADPTINDHGEIAFRGVVSGSGVNASDLGRASGELPAAGAGGHGSCRDRGNGQLCFA